MWLRRANRELNRASQEDLAVLLLGGEIRGVRLGDWEAVDAVNLLEDGDEDFQATGGVLHVAEFFQAVNTRRVTMRNLKPL